MNEKEEIKKLLSEYCNSLENLNEFSVYGMKKFHPENSELIEYYRNYIVTIVANGFSDAADEQQRAMCN